MIQMPAEDIVSVSYEDPEKTGVWHKCSLNSVEVNISDGALRIAGLHDSQKENDHADG